MSKYSALIKRATSATTALALSLASLTPAVMLGSRASAGQMTERQINMSNSLAGADNNTYTVSFIPSGSSLVDGIVVEFCSNSPIIGTSCTAPTGLDVAGTTTPQTVDGVEFTVVSSTNKVTLTDNVGTGASATNADTYTFTMNVDNPDAVETFYARVLTFTSGATATAYTAGSPGAYTDAGGIALSTTNDVTINARVQEQLTFCAGATDLYTDISSCTVGWNGQVVDLGVLTSGTTATTPVSSATDGNAYEGAFFVTTNAFYGVKIYYTSPNSLKTSGVLEGNCEAGTTPQTDQCINSVGNAAAFPGIGTERFGMSVPLFDDNDNPDGEGTMTASNSYGTSYAWNTTAQTEIASSTGVISQEVGQLTFKANAAATTPSGYYTTSANFVAVAKF